MYAFPFYINYMSYLDSNIPSKIFCASISSEVLRIARTTTDLNNMIKRVSHYLIRMKKQGSEYTRIVSSLRKIFKYLGNTETL